MEPKQKCVHLKTATEQISASSGGVDKKKKKYKRHAYLTTERIDDTISAYKNKEALREAIDEEPGAFRSRRDIAHYLTKYSDPGGRVWITNPEAAEDPDDLNTYMPPPFGWADKAKCVALLATGPQAVWTELQSVADVCLDDKIKERDFEAETPCLCALMVAMKYFDPQHRNTANSLNRLGWVYVAKGELKLAEKLFAHALEAYEKCLGEQHPVYSGILQSLVWLKTSKFKPNSKPTGGYLRLSSLETRCLGHAYLVS